VKNHRKVTQNGHQISNENQRLDVGKKCAAVVTIDYFRRYQDHRKSQVQHGTTENSQRRPPKVHLLHFVESFQHIIANTAMLACPSLWFPAPLGIIDRTVLYDFSDRS
jgi:hypothetical protein